MTRYQGQPSGRGRRICVVTSRFNPMVTDRLLEGARDRLLEAGVDADHIDVISVPGAWELPLAARAAATRGYDAIVALGCVIRGETAHFDHIGRAAMDGLQRLQLESGVPVGLGILTPDSLEQALARAGGPVGHAGIQAAEAALEAADLLDRLGEGAGA
ncbi:MAG: 6,7-dimethyl-8-ribityllumazine synthase [Gemmatimonadota bacterium]|nr:6,7-dimethyl-8-ribityllumazine synthase [Gemmatimonadota bacterium]